MKFAVLSSGSRANCTYLEGGGTRVLIDCGLSGREAERRLALIGVEAQRLDALIVTHEHSDHIQGIPVLSRRWSLPVYANRGAAERLHKLWELREFQTGVSFEVGDLAVAPFSVVHDAADPVGLVARCGGTAFGYATDMGRVTPLVREALRGCSGLVVESNHDPEMLHACSYPWELKQRIASSHGHLSNAASAELLIQIAHAGLRHVVLAHLSENSNSPQAALETHRALNPHCFDTLICAAPDRPTDLIELESIEYRTAV